RCPNADAVYPEIISLPMFPAMTEGDVKQVVGTLQAIVESAERERWNKVA
ncbi:MAG: hypothetical protein GY748_23195, partial [Planctomycetaceae bacterium]|nr:hypothetical protein [Planctomycetaceae bacterium]